MPNGRSFSTSSLAIHPIFFLGSRSRIPSDGSLYENLTFVALFSSVLLANLPFRHYWNSSSFSLHIQSDFSPIKFAKLQRFFCFIFKNPRLQTFSLFISLICQQIFQHFDFIGFCFVAFASLRLFIYCNCETFVLLLLFQAFVCVYNAVLQYASAPIAACSKW